jgi:hypothetical protein
MVELERQEMSKFKIYRAESSEPRETGLRNRKLYVVYVIVFFLLLLITNLYYKFKEEHWSLIIYYSILSVIIIIIAFVIYRMKKQLNNLAAIGTIEFKRGYIKKEIGDLSTIYEYDSVLQIEIEKYLRDLSISKNIYGSPVYILTITNKDLSKYNFIISNRSVDFRQKMGIIETLKTVRSMTGLNIILNDN